MVFRRRWNLLTHQASKLDMYQSLDCLSYVNYRLGYTWEPQLAVPISSALVLYPISTWAPFVDYEIWPPIISFLGAVFTFFTMITLLPVLFARSARSDKIFAIFAWTSFAVSFLAFLFMIGMWGVAKSRFEKRGFGASYGNLVCYSWSLHSMFFCS